jgi:hypothetical protein
MATYSADIDWKLADGEDFPKGRYSRGHTLTFDGGTVVPTSASPHVVGKWAVKEAVDPLSLSNRIYAGDRIWLLRRLRFFGRWNKLRADWPKEA